jgi:hypothetical protein
MFTTPITEGRGNRSSIGGLMVVAA